ncbi:ATP-binding protein [Nakamurella sp. GG22]
MNPADRPASPAFAGPGEMRERFRSMDWAATPLGPLPGWPPLLRVLVELCLDSAFPMVVSWGPDVVMVYNDAYIPLLGAELHPAALGRPAKEVWPDAWSVSGPIIEEVMLGGRAVRHDDMQMVLERNGYPEECYFTFSQSPIRDTDGSIVGMFTVAAETTSQVLAQRRLRVAQQLGALSATRSNNPADTCQAAALVLAGARESVPFAAVFLRDEPDGQFRLVADYGFTGAPGPGLIEPAADGSWTVGTAVREERAQMLDSLRALLPDTLQPGPLGPLLPDQAVVLPLILGAGTGPAGAVVLGVNPYRPLDDRTQEFLALVGRQFRVALADAYAYHDERQRAQTLADLDHVKTEFFQNVSHELRTPLTLLLAPLQDVLANSSSQLDPPGRESLTAAVRAAERLQRMVEALLDLSHQASIRVPVFEETDLAATTADIASMFRSTAEHAGLDFTVQLPTGPVTADVDREMWATIVNNLLSNAVKYTARGGITITVRGLPAGFAELTVTDTGVGISSEQQPRVFERFHRAGDGGSDGAGIGLALVSDLVSAHGGRIELTSTPGAGSTFTVTVAATADPAASRAAVGALIPADGSATSAATQAAAPAPVQSAARQMAGGVDDRRRVESDQPGRPRLLLVEDDDDLRSYLGHLLTSDGWAVDAVADAESATAAAFSTDSGTPYGLVLTDIMLPGSSGLDLLTALRSADGTARVPIILLTARAGADSAIEGLSYGADDYITKPFSSQELLARVRVHHQLNQVREDALGEAHTRVTHLRTALDSNRLIGIATGVLVGSNGLTPEQAFAVLVKTSQNGNRKLREVAADVVGGNGIRP